MYGGNVSYDGNVIEGVAIWGRIAAAGTITAPTRVPKFTVTHTASSGVYAIKFSEQYAQFLGVQIAIEGSGVPAAAAVPGCVYSWSPATRTLTVTTWEGTATPTATDVPFAFCAKFVESVGP